MFPYVMSEEDDEILPECPVKTTTDALGGVKVQVYGPDSYGYLQIKDIVAVCHHVPRKDTSLLPSSVVFPNVEAATVVELPPALHNYQLTVEEWMDFLSRMDQIVRRYQRYDWAIKIGVLLGVVSFSIPMMVYQEYGTAIIVGAMFLVAVSSIPQNSKAELKTACRNWSIERRRVYHHPEDDTRSGSGSGSNEEGDGDTNMSKAMEEGQTSTSPTSSANTSTSSGKVGTRSLLLVQAVFHHETASPATTPRTNCATHCWGDTQSPLGIIHFLPAKAAA
jgi:hypothetical protein